MSVENIVKEIIVEKLFVTEEKVHPQASFVKNLGADAMDLIDLFSAFEVKFGIDIEDEDEERIRTVQDAIDYINKNRELKYRGSPP